MPTDLTTVQDHPAIVLRTSAVRDGDADHPHLAAIRALRSYEGNHKVTFAALDNETLKDVRDRYHALDRARSIQATGDFEQAVSDLLGLSDD